MTAAVAAATAAEDERRQIMISGRLFFSEGRCLAMGFQFFVPVLWVVFL
jgi:hypothetical protein